MDFERFSLKMKRINKIGRSETEGITRLSLSAQDIKARTELKNIFRELDLCIREDGVGNIWAKKEGTDKTLPKIVIGSHIDTVPNGGEYDGLLGVLSAVECLEMMKDFNFRNQCPIEIVSFSTEESSRFNISTVGSKIVTGRLKADTLSEYKDKDGVALDKQLLKCGFEPSNTENLNTKDIRAFFEVHIEQGPILERKNIDIGIVTDIAAPTRLIIEIIGETAHSGSFPMERRKDALVTASQIIIEVEKAGLAESKYKTVSTAGKVEVTPGVMNVVPGKVIIFVDIRGVDSDSILRTLNRITKSTERICHERGIKNKIEVICQEKPIKLDAKLVDFVEICCDQIGLSSLQLHSGAGHDAMNMATMFPSALIFVPCVGGVSHDKNENVRKIDIENGVNLLYKCLHELSK